MISFALICNTTVLSATISFAVQTTSTSIISSASYRSIQFKTRAFLNKTASTNDLKLPSVVSDSLRVLEWDKVCDSVASFAGTSLGQQTTKAKLWEVNQSYKESLKILEETKAAVEMHKHGGCAMNFSCIDIALVKSAIQHARGCSPVEGCEAMALVALLQFAESLQYNLKAAIKEDADLLQRFMPLAETIMDLVVSCPLVKFIQQLIDEDGSVKDSASPVLKRSRYQVRLLEQKLSELMESLICNAVKDRSSVEVSNINGRWCIKSEAELPSSFEGLFLPRCRKHCRATFCCFIK